MIRADLDDDLRDMPRGVLIHVLGIDMAPTRPVSPPSPDYPPHLLIDPWLNPGAWAAAVDNYAKEQGR